MKDATELLASRLLKKIRVHFHDLRSYALADHARPRLVAPQPSNSRRISSLLDKINESRSRRDSPSAIDTTGLSDTGLQSSPRAVLQNTFSGVSFLRNAEDSDRVNRGLKALEANSKMFTPDKRRPPLPQDKSPGTTQPPPEGTLATRSPTDDPAQVSWSSPFGQPLEARQDSPVMLLYSDHVKFQ